MKRFRRGFFHEKMMISFPKNQFYIHYFTFSFSVTKTQRTTKLFYFRDENFPLRGIEGAATSLFLIFTFLLFISLATKAQSFTNWFHAKLAREQSREGVFISPFGGLRGLQTHLNKLHIPG